MRYTYQNRPIIPDCGLIEDDVPPKDTSPKPIPQFPLSVFPPPIRRIAEALIEHEHFNPDFTAAAMFTTFAAAMGSRWRVRFSTTWVELPILYVVLVGPPSCGKTPPLKLSLSPLFKLDEEHDKEYCERMKSFQQWESKTPKERTAQGLPEDMERPKRRCHVVVNTTIEALIGAMRDNPQGVILYSDEIDSLLSNFNRYNGSDESYFLSAFSGTPLKYTRKSNDEHIFLPNPYCSIIGCTQPGLLANQFGGKRILNGFSSRFLKAYPDISRMPSWGGKRMPDSIMSEWHSLIRKVATFNFEGKETSRELSFSLEAYRRLCDWKENVNNAIYTSSDSEAVKAVCGKLDIYLMRFSLIIQVMKAICDGASCSEIDADSVDAAIQLIEYFREMEHRIIRLALTGNLDSRHSELLDSLPSDFRTADAINLGSQVGLSESTVKRFLKNPAFFSKAEHGRYLKISSDP